MSTTHATWKHFPNLERTRRKPYGLSNELGELRRREEFLRSSPGRSTAFVACAVPQMVDELAVKAVPFRYARFHLPGDDYRAKIEYLEDSRSQAAPHDSLEIEASLARISGD